MILLRTRARVFEEHRNHLVGLAYRMLGTLAEAQDVVQETYLRWSEAACDTIERPRAWLVTTCSRLALDLLKSARKARETYPGAWLPEPYLEPERCDPAERASLDETVSVALMVALERLSPAERAAYLLHDVFGHSFEEVGEILGKSPAASRKLASRARARVVAGRPRFTASAAEHRRLLSAFVAAARQGALEQLKELFVEQIELHADGGGRAPTASEVLRGAPIVAEFLSRVWGESAAVETELVPCRYNGGPGLLVRAAGRLLVALSVEVESGRIRRIFALRNPDKLHLFEALGYSGST